MKKLAWLIVILYLFLAQALQAQTARPLCDVLLNLGKAKEAFARKTAQEQAALQWTSIDRGPLYKSSPENPMPKKLPDDKIFEGVFIPASDGTILALFSDDGCDVWIDGKRVLDNFKKPQHLPNLDQSFHILKKDPTSKENFSFKKDQQYQIKIHYANTIFLGPTDIDGVTLFAFEGGGTSIIVELAIHNGLEGESESGGQEIKGEDKIKKGALTVANMNNTNGDTDPKTKADIVDKDQDNVVKDDGRGRDEIDLMKLIVKKPVPDMKGQATLKIVSGDVKLWKKSTKGGKKNEIEVDKNNEVKFTTGVLPMTLWIEARSHSKTVQDIVLELEYKGCKDTVTATAVWVKLNAIKNKPAKFGDPKAMDKDNMLFANLNDKILIDLFKMNIATNGSLFGVGPYLRVMGTEEIPVFRDTRIGGRILFEWELLPHGVESKGVFLDVTRQMFGRAREIKIGESTDVIDLKFPEDEMKDNEMPNEEDTREPILTKHNFYSLDTPSVPLDEIREFSILRFSFREWARLRLSPDNPVDAAIGINFINRNERVEGSRCSDKEDWHFIMYLRRGENGQFVFDNAPTSFSAPVRLGKGNGTAAVTLGASANTEGFTAVYDAAKQEWTLTKTSEVKPAAADTKMGPIPAGTTWTLNIPKVIKVVITQGATPFVKDDSFIFSVFKTTAPGGKQFEIDKGPINPLEGP